MEIKQSVEVYSYMVAGCESAVNAQLHCVLFCTVVVFLHSDFDIFLACISNINLASKWGFS